MKTVRVCGVGTTAVGRLGRSATALAAEAVDAALADAGLKRTDLDALITVPSLSNPHFMQAHYLATKMELVPSNHVTLRTLDTGGAGPISALTEASNFIRADRAEIVAVVAADAVLTLDSATFRQRADDSVAGAVNLPSPCIPHGYDRVAQWSIANGTVTREQLAMVPVLQSLLAAKHPKAMCRAPYTLDEVLSAPAVAPVTGLKECARRADGAAALILGSSRALRRFDGVKELDRCPVVISTGEGSGPLYPPREPSLVTEDMFSCERACRYAYKVAQLGPMDIDYFSLYDCFPICLIRALEAVKLCPKGEGGRYIEKCYRAVVDGSMDAEALARELYPINTHGGLQCFGAPWEAPAMFGVVEAVQQLSGTPEGVKAVARRDGGKPRRALVYGNGGIFSASSVAILGDGVYA